MPVFNSVPSETIRAMKQTIADTLATAKNELRQDLNNKASFYIHDQTAPSTVWTINHNLNKPVSITTFSTNGMKVDGSILSDGLNKSTITFASVFAGIAYCI